MIQTPALVLKATASISPLARYSFAKACASRKGIRIKPTTGTNEKVEPIGRVATVYVIVILRFVLIKLVLTILYSTVYFRLAID